SSLTPTTKVARDRPEFKRAKGARVLLFLHAADTILGSPWRARHADEYEPPRCAEAFCPGGRLRSFGACRFAGPRASESRQRCCLAGRRRESRRVGQPL